MAEFRKLFYAFGLAALIAGSANAQTTTCTASGAAPPIIRSESFSELVGDYVLDCTGGVPTAQGAVVPTVNFTVTMSTQITSRLLGAGFTEALLLVDEPNAPVVPGATNPATGTTDSTPLLSCGDANAPDNTTSGPGVCPITVATGASVTPAQTYNGTAGHPNVFQGKVGVAQNANDSNIIVFPGVPFDPPGTQNSGSAAHRTFRFTNFRVNAPLVASGFVLQSVVMYVNVNGSTQVVINNPSVQVASVQRGLQPVTVTPSTTSFVQCISPTGSNNGGSISFTEGFESSFKVRNVGQTLYNGVLSGSSGPYRVNTGSITYRLSDNYVQNVPGALYNTESGFVATPGFTIPNPNGPLGISTYPSTQAASVPFPAATATTTQIANAGRASQGTRLVVSFRDLPAGLTASIPLVVDLTNAGGQTTGKALLVSTTANGSDSVLYTTTLATSGVVGSNSIAVYEIAFSDPAALETMTVPVTISYTPNLASNLPEPFKTASAAGGFAPFLTASDSNWQLASATLPTPRFRNVITNYGNLFSLTKCACNLLFPFVTNANVAPGNSFDTGIAIANTSALPSGNFGYSQTSQEGSVQFWFYPALSTTTAPPTQCTNTTSPGTCPGTKTVKAGETLTYVLSTGSSQWGLVGAPGFTGYMVAQTQFQYCHAFAYISAQGAGPTSPGMSVGYLGLILDKANALQTRTSQNFGEALNQ